MDAIRRRRRQQQINAARPSGLTTQFDRLWASQVDAMTHEAALARLPVDSSQAEDLQNEDGSFRFMWGYSAFGGPDGF